MIIKNEDINLLIKMENLIGINEKRLFGKNKDKKYTVKWYDNTETIINFDDFISFMNLIERALQDKQKASDKANNYNKANKEYHNITVNMAHYKKKGNIEKYNYWKNKLDEYKKNK